MFDNAIQKLPAETLTETDLVFVLLRVASLILHLQNNLFQFLLRASHKLGGTLPLPE